MAMKRRTDSSSMIFSATPSNSSGVLLGLEATCFVDFQTAQRIMVHFKECRLHVTKACMSAALASKFLTSLRSCQISAIRCSATV